LNVSRSARESTQSVCNPASATTAPPALVRSSIKQVDESETHGFSGQVPTIPPDRLDISLSEIRDHVAGIHADLQVMIKLVSSIVGEGVKQVMEPKDVMTTEEAATYLRKSVSWMLRRKDIPYTRGAPNIYARKDLDAWMDDNKHVPRGY